MPTVCMGDRIVELKAVIYDKDGTLFDPRPLWVEVGTRRLQALITLGVSPDDAAFVGKAIGFRMEDRTVDGSGPLARAPWKEEAVAAAAALYLRGYGWTEARDLAFEAYRAAEKALDVERTAVAIQGLAESLDALSRAGVRLGVVTTDTRNRTRRLLEAAGLPPVFGAIIGSEDACRPKPDPEPILLACAQLEVDPCDAAYIGDSMSDMRAAHAAGLKVKVGVLTGVGGRDELGSLADCVLESAAMIKPAHR